MYIYIYVYYMYNTYIYIYIFSDVFIHIQHIFPLLDLWNCEHLSNLRWILKKGIKAKDFDPISLELIHSDPVIQSVWSRWSHSDHFPHGKLIPEDLPMWNMSQDITRLRLMRYMFISNTLIQLVWWWRIHIYIYIII